MCCVSFLVSFESKTVAFPMQSDSEDREKCNIEIFICVEELPCTEIQNKGAIQQHML